MKKIPVKNFWMEPNNPPLSAREVQFGYSVDGKEKRYEVKVKGDDLKSFHSFMFKLLAAKKGMYVPWPFTWDEKGKIKVTNLDDDSEQMELNLRG